MRLDCDFLFAVLAEKHNAVIRRIREIPPWEWGGEMQDRGWKPRSTMELATIYCDAAGRRGYGERDDMKKRGLRAALPGISTDLEGGFAVPSAPSLQTLCVFRRMTRESIAYSRLRGEYELEI